MKREFDFTGSLLNSYSQIFFSDNRLFAGILILVTFVDFYTGLFGLLAVLTTTLLARYLGFHPFKIQQGYYGFNSLLVGLGLGIFFQPGPLLVLIVILASILTLFIAVSCEGIIGKYALPYLSIPFVVSMWILTLASREFQALGLNERGIYTLNDLYIIGGNSLVQVYDWWNQLAIHSSIRAYFLSLGAILFQYNMLTGILVAVGLFLYSRIAFTLSLLGFYTAYFFYMLIGAPFSEVSYSYIGFNYILTAIATGGYFIIPNKNSYMWAILTIPLVAVMTIGLSRILAVFYLPVYSLPFNVLSLLFLYVLKFRVDNRANLTPVLIQQNTPEKNLYSYLNFMERFGKESTVPVHLPFFGEWIVTQGHDGEYTHQDRWRHAWDFEIADETGQTWKNSGDFREDYFCYDKTIIAPADGTIETVVDDIPDNTIGERNLEQNWGNTIVIKHEDDLFTKLSHLKPGSIQVKPGDKVRKGDMLARCGNSGNSPYPHLHFQVQQTPYIGSETLDYPICNYMLRHDKEFSLKTYAIPEKGDRVFAVQVNSALKKAFHFIPGEKIRFTLEDVSESLIWDVKINEFLNTYIECRKTGSKAWFKTDDAMLYFTHFEGARDSLLYHFYCAAFRVCFGYYKGLVIEDSFPLSMVFSTKDLIFQDFAAPFIRYKKGQYQLSYTSLEETLSDTRLLLESAVTTYSFGKIRSHTSYVCDIDNGGLKTFSIHQQSRTRKALCATE
ncbi:MAG: urea transporter [Fidelibacterota bacterium]